MTENLSHSRTIEESLKRALVLAEETSKETIENANNKAQALEAEASRNAKQLVSEAEDQAEKILTSAKEDFKEEKEQHEKTIENYQKLIRLRKEKPVIVYGVFEALYRDHDQIFAYTSTLEGEKLLTVCNFSEQSAEFEVPAEFEGSQCLITNLDRKVFKGKIVLKPYEAFVLYK